MTPARTPVSVVPNLCFALLINPPDSGFASNGEIRQAELGNDTTTGAALGGDRGRGLGVARGKNIFVKMDSRGGFSRIICLKPKNPLPSGSAEMEMQC